MPIYEYRCTDCGYQKEYLRKMSDAPLTDCPKCGATTLRKMVTAAGFMLKGSGWYATDFKNGSRPKSKPEDKASTPPAEKPAAKSDAKPAPEATAKKPEAAAKKSEAAASPVTSGTGAGSA